MLAGGKRPQDFASDVLGPVKFQNCPDENQVSSFD